MHSLGERAHTAEGFKAEVAAVAYLSQAGYKALPIDVQVLTVIAGIGIWKHVQVGHAVVIMNMHYAETVSERLDVLLYIA